MIETPEEIQEKEKSDKEKEEDFWNKVEITKKKKEEKIKAKKEEKKIKEEEIFKKVFNFDEKIDDALSFGPKEKNRK